MRSRTSSKCFPTASGRRRRADPVGRPAPLSQPIHSSDSIFQQALLGAEKLPCGYPAANRIERCIHLETSRGQKKKRELSEDAAWQIALEDHPEWCPAWEGGTLPEEVVGEDGEPMSPRMHLTIHAIVERQLAADDPKGVVAIARELQQLGISRHDIRHEIGRAVVTQMWQMIKEGRIFDEGQYLAELREIVQSHG